MTETLPHGYPSESTQGELSNEYQHDMFKIFFTNLCVLVLWTKVASALDGLGISSNCLSFGQDNCKVYSKEFNPRTKCADRPDMLYKIACPIATWMSGHRLAYTPVRRHGKIICLCASIYETTQRWWQGNFLSVADRQPVDFSLSEACIMCG